MNERKETFILTQGKKGIGKNHLSDHLAHNMTIVRKQFPKAICHRDGALFFIVQGKKDIGGGFDEQAAWKSAVVNVVNDLIDKTKEGYKILTNDPSTRPYWAKIGKNNEYVDIVFKTKQEAIKFLAE